MPKGATSTNPAFKTRLWHRRLGYFLRVLSGRAEGWRTEPTLASFPAAPETTPSALPPVRIFIGTEPGQSRAERVLIWSILKQRDPARAYEIYLMKDLAGFARRYWKTGFTNYRYAIPHFAGGQGRAIYNDADQIYLDDPAKLFDQPMGPAGNAADDTAGVLSIDDRETSVLLLDCAKMAAIWPLALAQENAARHREFRSLAMAIKGAWRQMSGAWNARDGEFVEGQSKLLHFTTLQTQPWRPFPNEFHYVEHPAAALWSALEAEADTAKFTPFTREKPSPHYQTLIDLHAAMHIEGDHNAGIAPVDMFAGTQLPKRAEEIKRLIDRHAARTILDYGAGKGAAYAPHTQKSDGRDKGGNTAASPWQTLPAWGAAVRVRLYDPGYKPLATLPDGPFDGVICNDVLEHIPEEDIPWTLDAIFQRAQTFIYLVAACYPAKKQLANGLNAHAAVLSPDWWRQEVEAAARRNPGIAWTLRCRVKPGFLPDRLYEG